MGCRRLHDKVQSQIQKVVNVAQRRVLLDYRGYVIERALVLGMNESQFSSSRGRGPASHLPVMSLGTSLVIPRLRSRLMPASIIENRGTLDRTPQALCATLYVFTNHLLTKMRFD